MARHRNIYRAGGESSFALSAPVLSKLLASPSVNHSTIALYVYLVSKADGPTFRLHVGTILVDTGLSRQTYLNGRDELRRQHLLQCVETSKQGMCEFARLSWPTSLIETGPPVQARM